VDALAAGEAALAERGPRTAAPPAPPTSRAPSATACALLLIRRRPTGWLADASGPTSAVGAT